MLFTGNFSETSIPLAVDLCKSHPFYRIGEILWRIGVLLCLALGIPGHMLVVTVMLNVRNRSQPVSLYFATIAIFEFVYLLIIFWLWCSSLTSLPDPRHILTCGTFYSLTIGSSNISTLLLTMASIDRVLVILCPGRYSTFVSRRKAVIKILLIILLVLLLFVHYRQSFSFSPSIHVCEYYSYALLSHGRLWPLIRVVLLAFVPCMIICLCSVIILKNRYNRRLSVGKETASAKHMRAASLMLVIYSIYYTLSIMPLNVLQFFHSFFLEHAKVQTSLEIHCLKFSQWAMLMKFCMLLMLINYSNKFFFHCFISIRFRRDVWNLVTKCSYIPEKFGSQT